MAEKIILQLQVCADQDSTLKTDLQNIVTEVKNKNSIIDKNITTSLISEWSYKTLESNYTSLQKRYKRYRDESHLLQDIGLVSAGSIITAILFIILR